MPTPTCAKIPREISSAPPLSSSTARAAATSWSRTRVVSSTGAPKGSVTCARTMSDSTSGMKVNLRRPPGICAHDAMAMANAPASVR